MIDLELENKVLGYLLHSDKETRNDILPYLDNFVWQGDNQNIYNGISELHNNGADELDTIVLYYHLKNRIGIDLKLTKKIGLLSTVGMNAKIYDYVACLLETSYKNNLDKTIRANLKMIESGTDVRDIEEIKSGLISDLNEITIDDKAIYLDFKHHKRILINHILSGNEIMGYKWGQYLHCLNNITSGIIKPRVYVIGGLKKSGKTRFLIHTIKELYKQKAKCGFLSLEMPESEINMLLISSFLNINDSKLRSGKLNYKERAEIESFEIDKNLISIECVAGIGTDAIISRLKRWKKEGNEIIFIDYIQRIRHDENRQAQELERISIRLSDIARQEKIALIITSQLSNIGERETPTVGHLKGSGGIAESADTIILLDNLYRRKKKDEDENKMDIYIEQRHGLAGMEKIQCDLGCVQFRDLIKTENKEIDFV